MYNITWWCDRVVIITVEKQQCILFYFPTCLINCTTFWKKIIERKVRVLIISTFSV